MSRAAICVALLFHTLAQATPFTVDIRPLVNRPRPGAPAWVEVNVPAHRGGLREGALEFVRADDEHGTLRYRTPEIALIGTPQRFRFLLPNISQPDRSETEDLRVRFIDRDGAIDVGNTNPLPSFRTDRPLVVAVVREAGGVAAGCWPALRLERYADATPSSGGAGVTTQAAHLEPADLPVDPLGYCAFDMVVLESGAFPRVREKARAALGRWVEAGGSVCVVRGPDGGAEQLALLNEIGGIDPKWTPLTGSEAFAFARVHFGRFVVAASPPYDEAAQTALEWRRVCTFLWKLRALQADAILREGRWRTIQRKNSWQAPDTFSHGLGLHSAAGPLIPNSLRLMPRWVLFVLGVGFIALIGPGEWFILGALRQRRWTWVVFPVVAVGVTALTVFLARHFTGTATHRGALIVTDLGTHGRVVRETRIEMLLPGRNQTETRELAATLVSPGDEVRAPNDDTTLAGQFPARYTFTQFCRQWTPRLTRTLSFADGPDTSGVQWDAFDPAEAARPWSQAFSRKLSPNLEHGFDVFQGGTYQSSGSEQINSQWRFLTAATRESGLGQLLTQLSPTGSAALDDLPCFEIGDESRSLLVAFKRDGADIRIWRRIYLR
jgi:hypothetical protein